MSSVDNAEVSGCAEHNTRANRGECSFHSFQIPLKIKCNVKMKSEVSIDV